MRNILFALFLLFLTVGFVGEGLCHPVDGPEFKKEAVRKRGEVMRVWELTRVLDLDERTASKLFPLLHKYHKKRGEIHQSIKEDKRELKKALEEESYGQIKRILKRLEWKQKELQGLNDEERAELKDILTIEQQAKFVLFHHKFEKDMKKILAEVERRRFGMD